MCTLHSLVLYGKTVCQKKNQIALEEAQWPLRSWAKTEPAEWLRLNGGSVCFPPTVPVGGQWWNWLESSHCRFLCSERSMAAVGGVSRILCRTVRADTLSLFSHFRFSTQITPFCRVAAFGGSIVRRAIITLCLLLYWSSPIMRAIYIANTFASFAATTKQKSVPNEL